MYVLTFVSSDRDRWHTWTCERPEDEECAIDLIENMGGLVWDRHKVSINKGDE